MQVLASVGDLPERPQHCLNLPTSVQADLGYMMFDAAKQSIAKGLDRRDLHLIDWDGDGA